MSDSTCSKGKGAENFNPYNLCQKISPQVVYALDEKRQ